LAGKNSNTTPLPTVRGQANGGKRRKKVEGKGYPLAGTMSETFRVYYEITTPFYSVTLLLLLAIISELVFIELPINDWVLLLLA
jgi:hypothetical protein